MFIFQELGWPTDRLVSGQTRACLISRAFSSRGSNLSPRLLLKKKRQYSLVEDIVGFVFLVADRLAQTANGRVLERRQGLQALQVRVDQCQILFVKPTEKGIELDCLSFLFLLACK